MSTSLTPDAAALALNAGEIAARVLPSAEKLTCPGPQPGTENVIGAFAAAVMAELVSPLQGRVAVLVGADLVGALAASPIDGLDLAAAVQPTLDAIAKSLGAGATAGQEVDLQFVVPDLDGSFTALPLLGSGFAAAVLLPDTVLEAAAALANGTAPEPTAAPAEVAEASVDEAAAVASANGTAPAGEPVAVTVPPLPQMPVPQSGLPARGIEMLHGVDMELTVEIGRTRLTVREVLELAPGAVLELDRAAGSPADLLVNGRLIARGEVVVVDEDFGLRITEIVSDGAPVSHA